LFRRFLPHIESAENLALFAAAFYSLRPHPRHGSNLASLDFVDDVEFPCRWKFAMRKYLMAEVWDNRVHIYARWTIGIIQQR
jgi:hypothetical protein